MMNFIIQISAAFVATLAAAITLEVPNFLLYRAGILGGLSYIVFIASASNYNLYTGYFFACLFFSFGGHILARRVKAPVTIFLIPSFFLYVPGASMYRVALYFIQGEYDLSQQYLIETLSIAGIIAVGVFLVDSIFETFYRIYSLRNKTKRI